MGTRPPTYRSIGEPQPSDAAVGEWSERELTAMDRKFAARMERAIEAGQEHPPTLEHKDARG
jgi:hypothetical protein